MSDAVSDAPHSDNDDAPAGDAAPGAAHHPVDDEAAAAKAQETARAANDAGHKGGSGGGGASADAPADAGEADEEGAEPSASVSESVPELHGHPLTDSLGQAVVHCAPQSYLQLCRALHDEGYDMMIGVTAVDYLVHPGRALPDAIAAERFEVVVELAAVTTRRRIRVRCQVPAADPTVPTLFDVWPGAEAHERETYDMYGIVFEGHPDPSRILMPEDWEGHPLRKDYATGRVPVQFKESPGRR
ncbi:MAG: NADH-quinone oxidoreductase subunit C [Actinomycetota bacterium]|nr:NADH-quinone oxidoreductase subunit C [Actinomycetota bacterium]